MNLMHQNTKPTFTVDTFDKDGDLMEEGIFLHFGETRIFVGERARELDFLADNIKHIAHEIRENYES